MLNLANRITLTRLAAVPVCVILLNFPNKLSCMLAMCFFLAGALTDFLDGYIARSRNMITSLGKFLDPLADKLLVISLLVMLVQLQTINGASWAPAWIVIIIIAREMAVTGLRAVAMEQGVVMAADRWGKFKTVSQIIAISLLTLHYPWFGLDPQPLGKFFLYIALVLTIISGANYFRSFFKAQRNSDGSPSQ
ncbi:CDP-diacylglycerol--glycerol-3-phosphate 3-phosphatidyltransferase [Oceanidesulfovibrio marinus]|uniref:CDP-diacylglycerol--glycerol-3-phosphate 3-phosphatidyltransferase n=1 Tax=Oceanidesulfovibrio marinus TaxID=370038 RepID=A0A6P1ZJZ5_9BACT|nr:CDP-diacylglycerol--glycerol-3-phosphate 3-phosphatidyltransferase [Oceanidesulfovibrio marinus]QJT08225.1 CDP-diacylglycerol--glycerol-3-phosphate 3-phosphatidyltransferase [Oceanidesulfovibrio marinus]TVM35120.1 CDP-diacylglycerol--glycerol-3-phosphate 3-phosphatidyltransferase [Oceanidesulfovibrio marinus]